ncbi:hypothetical protein [Novosphingobium sp. TCA1]|uniref:hypothetical protein n=1 Tax=Novosphingobium sp. TCA1 TaxID=2682474 RepID=UPI00130ABCDF|nr:hypothetical protein [Novosphingobium sp. TCA1]GFE77839.1 hypothetical protein NTCA1_54880 [Novosphingobium sp. TCA1]
MQNDLKEFLKRVSNVIGDLANSLQDYVDEENNDALKESYKEQIADAKKLDEDIMEIIGQLSRDGLNSK